MQSKTDKELLDIFVAAGDGSAFAELVARYSPMVYRACRRLLGNDHDAEDATQAAFVVLARKAGSLRQEGRLNGWLHRVARLVALEALQKRTDRERHQTESALWQESLAADLSEADRETVLRQVDAALDSLSAVLREAVVLRHLRGFSEQEAAAQAGCAVSAMKWRTSDGLAKLRQRLAKRGVALSGVALAGLLTSEASAAVPETLLPSILATVKTAVVTTATATGATSTAAMLAKGAMKAMFIAKVKMVAVVCVVAAAAGLSVPIGLTVAGMTNKSDKETCMTNSASQDVVTGVAVPMGIAVAQAANEVKPARTVQTAGPAQDTKQELDKLQGEWTMDSLEESGKKVPDEFVKTFKLMIQGGKWMVQCGDGKPGKATFKIDPSKNPKTIDLTFEFEDKEEVSPGIYKVDGDTLTLCRSTSGKAERPTEFKIRDVQDVLVVWKRAKK